MDLLERFKIQVTPEQDSDPEENFDSPNGSKWIVAIDDEGKVHVLSRPNIHYAFFDNGSTAEEIGLPYETENEPGIYEWICILNQTTDWESGHVDGWDFDVIEETLLWTWEKDGKADESGNKEAQPDSGSDKL